MAGPHHPSMNAIEPVVAKSILAEFPPPLLQTLLRDAIRLEIPAGTVLYDEQDDPRCGLVIAGLIRVYMTSPDGRQITVRYARAGDMLGIAAIVGGPAPTSVQILSAATLLILNPQLLQRSGQEETRVGWLLAQEIARRLYDTLDALAGNTFGTLRQQLARHLLDLAATRQQGQDLIVRATQQELADAVGSVRPVISRIIRDFRIEGLISNSSDGIVILHPAELHAITWSRDR